MVDINNNLTNSQQIDGQNLANWQQLLIDTFQKSPEDLSATDLQKCQEFLKSFTGGGDNLLPGLEAPKTNSTGNAAVLSLGGLSMEVLMDAIGVAIRDTEVKAGSASMKARADQRESANQEKLKKIQENLEKIKEQQKMSPFLKFFKILGMVLGAIASVAMIGAGAVGLAAGGSGAALLAVGIATLLMTASSITEEATDGKVGFSPGFIAGKIAKACGASDEVAGWINLGVNLVTTIVMAICTFGASAGSTAADAASKTTQVVSESQKALQMADKISNVAIRATTIAGAATNMVQSGLGIANSVYEYDKTSLQAARKQLEAIMERLAMLNELDQKHIKDILEKTEQCMQQISDIVQEGVQTNTAILTNNPSMA